VVNVRDPPVPARKGPRGRALVRQVMEDPLWLEGRPPSVVLDFLAQVKEAFRAHPPPLLARIPSDRPIQVVGDLHGDYVALQRALHYARGQAPPHRLVALGDYIDRNTRSQPDPPALPGGSLWVSARLLAWTSQLPGEVVALQGNHESARRLPVPGPSFLREIRRALGREHSLEVYGGFMDLLERLPWAARTRHGVFLAHGGIPPPGRARTSRWRRQDLGLLEGLVWSDPEVDYRDRGVGFPYTRSDFDAALRDLDCGFMIKGHAPDHSGHYLFGRRLLTLHTSDLFETFGRGGVLMAEVPASPWTARPGRLVVRDLRGLDRPGRAPPSPRGSEGRTANGTGRGSGPGQEGPQHLPRSGSRGPGQG
jgi:hypothetical protein